MSRRPKGAEQASGAAHTPRALCVPSGGGACRGWSGWGEGAMAACGRALARAAARARAAATAGARHHASAAAGAGYAAAAPSPSATEEGAAAGAGLEPPLAPPSARWRPPPFPSIAPALRAAGADVCDTYVRGENTSLVAGYHGGRPVLDLQRSEQGLRSALQFVHALLVNKPDAHVLFLHDDRDAAPLTLRAARLVGQSFMPKWVGGMLTNWSLVTRNVPEYLAQRDAGAVPAEKKERQLYRRLEKRFGGIRKGDFKQPDLVIVMNMGPTTRAALQECELMGVPVVGLVDLDTNPKRFMYPIPANTRSKVMLHAVLDLLVKALAPSPQTEQYDEALRARSRMLREFAASSQRSAFAARRAERAAAFAAGERAVGFDDPWQQFADGGDAGGDGVRAAELHAELEDEEVSFNPGWTQEDEDALEAEASDDLRALFEREEAAEAAATFEAALDGGEVPDGATYNASFALEVEEDAAELQVGAHARARAEGAEAGGVQKGGGASE